MRRARKPAAPSFALACLALLLTAAIWQFAASGAGAAPGGELVAQPSFGSPAATFLGASPQEAAGEAWATTADGSSLARYTDAGGWETMPPPVSVGGGPIAELGFPFGAAIGRTTAGGGVVVAAHGVDAEEEERQLLIVRDPGGALREAPEPPEGLLGPGENFLDEGEEGSGAPLLAATEAGGGKTRALLVPGPAGNAPQGILSFAAGNWSYEPICVGFVPGPCTAPPPQFRALAIEAAEGQAWLLAKGAAPGEGIELFRREGSGETTDWRQQSLGPPGSLGARYAEASPLGVPVAARSLGQPLTVSGAGVWVDAQLGSGAEAHEATLYYDLGAGEVTGSWCDLETPAGLCAHPLAAELPAEQGRSFAWPASGAGQPYGRRVVTGVGQGAILSLEGSAFARIALVGGEAGAREGAALSAPDEGWLGANPPLRLTRNPEPAQLRSWPVPFRRPLTAIASQPGAPVGSLGSEALAVGDAGEVARYQPGQGWEPEFLLTGSGKRATPTLRGVAWPEPERAFAVGDGGAMWVWQKATGLWGPDPAAPPSLIRANFTGIAFDPNRASRGYAVGKQGLLLGYGRSWTQESLPPGVPAEANFTSIAFAGSQAIATYKYPVNRGGIAAYAGGVISNDGSGWKVDAGAEAALGDAVPQRVAGLPEGSAAIAAVGGRTAVVEREGNAGSWQAAPGGSIGYPAALAAVREGGAVRALVSVSEGQQGLDLASDEEQVFALPPPGQPPLLTDPYPLPAAGLLVRQTASGWRDEQHQAFPLPEVAGGQTAYDMPGRPDPLLALLVSPEGGEGWALGGETGSLVRFGGEAVQTADVMRYGSTAAPPSNVSGAPLSLPAGTVSFAVGGNAQCAGPCADLAGTGIAPDRWLRAAVGTAAGIGGLRAFLYTGPGVASSGFSFSERLGATLSPAAFAREEAAYARRLGGSAGALPTFAAAAETDVDASGSLGAFQAAFAGFGAPLGSAPPGAGVVPVTLAGPGQGFYSFSSVGGGGTVRVIVLDYSAPSLGESQRCWLAAELHAAGAAGSPAIVVGGRDLAGQAPNAAEDAAQVVPILIGGKPPPGCVPSGPETGASAYFFNYPAQNRAYSLISGGRSIPAFGSGTLGYVAPPRVRETDWVGAGGFLLASVGVGSRNPTTNVAPVSVQLTPDIGGLALDATDGTLLRRSRQALFEALARRPQAGSECVGSSAPSFCEEVRPDPYVPIPARCQGTKCATGLFPEYTFASSNPEIADFVKPDPASINPRNVLLINERPVPDPHSGLLCAFNAGTTTVTISTGGLSYSQKVTVLAGTAQRPCGTTPLRNQAVSQPAVSPPPLAPTPTPGFASGPTALPPPPAPSLPTPAPPPAPQAVQPPPPAPPAPAAFVPPAVPPAPLVPIVPPPPPAAAEPTPPSGTSPISAVVTEREDEVAYDVVHHMSAASPIAHAAPSAVPGTSGGAGPPVFLPVLVLLAAIAAVGGLGGLRARRRPAPRLAHQTTPRRYR